jgi:peroxiredoxin (alkyl hydroperoxide reductase subunit C)
MCIDEPDTCTCAGEVTSLPLLGDPAPDFEVLTTHGPLKLSDYRGRWVVMFSHPADFTPVCTTEFLAFAGIADELAAMNVQLLGLSVDSVPAHLAWVRAIREKMGIDVPFPIIADLEMTVAKRYGMIQPAMSTTACVRAVFVIDDKGVLRAMIYYPLTTGRNMAEIVRLIRPSRPRTPTASRPRPTGNPERRSWCPRRRRSRRCGSGTPRAWNAKTGTSALRLSEPFL